MPKPPQMPITPVSLTADQTAILGDATHPQHAQAVNKLVADHKTLATINATRKGVIKDSASTLTACANAVDTQAPSYGSIFKNVIWTGLATLQGADRTQTSYQTTEQMVNDKAKAKKTAQDIKQVVSNLQGVVPKPA